MNFQSITNPEKIEKETIRSKINSGTIFTIQFDNPNYSDQILNELNECSKEFGLKFKIRFYSHLFNGTSLKKLQDVQSLSIDCTQKAINIELLSCLRNLKKLSLGIFEMDNVDILSIDALKNLESLTLHDTRKSNIDLSYLTDYKNLTEFQTSGHVKNISSITELPNLKSLTLWNIKKKNSLSFITHIKGLKELSIYLGGRESIEEINNSNIENLKIVRVRGLQSLGNLGRFPNLEILRVEDQIKLKDIKFHKNSNLIKLLISNCKTLSQLLGIEQLKNLTLLNIHKTAVEYETFIEQELPKTISHLGFYTTKSTINKKIKTDLDLKGYK